MDFENKLRGLDDQEGSENSPQLFDAQVQTAESDCGLVCDPDTSSKSFRFAHKNPFWGQVSILFESDF